MRGDVGNVGADVFEQRGAIEMGCRETIELFVSEPVMIHRVNENGVAEHDVGHAADGAVLIFLGDADRSPVATGAGGIVVPDGRRVRDVGCQQVEVLGSQRGVIEGALRWMHRLAGSAREDERKEKCLAQHDGVCRVHALEEDAKLIPNELHVGTMPSPLSSRVRLNCGGGVFPPW